MTTVPVVVWADRPGLVEDLERRGSGVLVVRHCEDLAEVLATVSAGLASRCILAGPAVEIGTAFIDSLAKVGGRGICLVAEAADRLRLQRVGMQVLPLEAEVEEVLEAVRSQESNTRDPVPRPGLTPPSGAWGPAVSPPAPVPPDDVGHRRDADDAAGRGPTGPGEAGGPAVQDTTQGVVTVVWGAPGAPGRSTVALNLAVELALNGERVALVDADTHAASLAAMLGMLDETAGIVRLSRSVAQNEFDPGPDTAAFARVRVGDAALRFTSGLPRPQRWAEISANGLGAALQVLRRSVHQVVVDVAAPAEQDEDLALDTFAPQRNDATVAALGQADRILVLGTGDPVGLPRLIRCCEHLGERPGEERPRIDVVVNRVRASSSGPRPEASLQSAWRRFGPAEMVPTRFLPWDQEATDAAVLQGKALVEVAPRSALRRAIRDLAAGPAGPLRSGEGPVGAAEQSGRRTRQRRASGGRRRRQG